MENRYFKSELSRLLDIYEPFLFIDEVFNIIPGEKASSITRIEKDSWFFKSHLPSQGSYMPGVLITEVMLQTTVIPIYKKFTLSKLKKGFVYSFDVKLINPISPKHETQILTTHSSINSHKRGISHCESAVYYEDKILASAKIVHVISL